MIQTLLFDRSGKNPVEVEPSWDNITWRLNKTGEAKFTLPYSDPKCTPDNLRYGNRVLIRFDNGLPSFGGVIDVPRRHSQDGVTVSIYDASRILSWRLSQKTATFTSEDPGTIFQSLIEDMNATFQTGIAVGGVYTGGAVRTETYHYAKLLDEIFSLQRLSGNDWEIVPSYESGVLEFVAYWYERQGVDKSDSVLLSEGLNIEDVQLDEQGPLGNHIYLPGGGAGGTSWNDRAIGEKEDDASRNLYDLREYVEVQTSVFDQITLDNSATTLLSEMAYPKRRFAPRAINRDPAHFADYDIGDILTMQALTIHSLWTFDGTIRILGREFSKDGTCKLEVEEW
jgi:hypothetical protein